VIIFSYQSSNAVIENAFMDAIIHEAEIIYNDLPITTQIEWIANFSLGSYLFSRCTTRQQTVVFNRKRYREDIVRLGLKKHPYPDRDHFRCECTVEDKKLSLVVGKVLKKIASEEVLPGFIEFSDIYNCLPSDDTKQMILAALSFTFGRQLVSVGSTSLSKDNERVSYTVRTVNLLGEQASYKQHGRPPVKLDIPDKISFVDENKVSFILNAVVEKMKELNLDHSLYLVWLSESSPLTVKAAHLGAAIESLRDSYCSGSDVLKTTLLPKNLWKKIKKPILESFDTAISLEPKIQEGKDIQILRRKLENLHTKSSNMQYEDFFEFISLKIGEVESYALNERNNPAHGHRYSPETYQDLVMTTDALYTLFNRIVLKITNASDFYIDYSTYEHPVRHIDEPLGGPEGDGCPARKQKK
jgi:hypothetical protein